MDDRSRAAIEEQLLELLDFPREDVDTEIKDWLPLQDKVARANLAIELIALAIMWWPTPLRLSDEVAGWPPSGICPHPLQHYAQDAINNILKAYAEPPFECHVDHLAASDGNNHVVIRVPGGHRVPIRSKKSGPSGSRLKADVYYVRRPGPESAPPQSGREWTSCFVAASRLSARSWSRASATSSTSSAPEGRSPRPSRRAHLRQPPCRRGADLVEPTGRPASWWFLSGR